MRCLNLAGALREQGADVTFICRALAGALSERVTAQGFGLRLLPASRSEHFAEGQGEAHAARLGATSSDDAEETLEVLRDVRPEWLVVDHYALDVSWETRVRRFAARILAIDDVADRRHDCELLLDQNYFPQPEARYSGRVPSTARLLLGPRYALLHSEYTRMHAQARTRTQVSRMLVFLGGGDQSGALAKVAEALHAPSLRNLEITIVVGSTASQSGPIEALARDNHKVRVHTHTDHMAAFIAAADLCLGAGGISVWERACLALPSVVIAVAEHQIAPAEAMAREGYLVYLGRADEVAAAAITAAVEDLVADESRLRALSRAARELVDGRGAYRVCEAMQ